MAQADDGTINAGGTDGGVGGQPALGGDGAALETGGAEGGAEQGAGAAPATELDALAAALGKAAPAAGTEDAGAVATPAGTAKPGDKAGEPAPTKGGEPAAKPKRQADPDFAPPQGLTPEAQARFTKLVDRVRSAEGKGAKYDEILPRYQAMEQDVGELRKMMEEHHATPELLGNALQYIKASQSGDLRGARDLLLGELKRIGLELGEDIELLDPLSDHPDLAEKVAAYQLSREDAIQMAKYRKAEADRQAQERARQQEQQGTRADIEAQERAINQIEDWAKQLRETDIDFKVKEKRMLEMIDDIIREYPPNLWLSTLKRSYSLISAGSWQVAAGGGQGGEGSTPRPLRPGNTGGGMSQEPKSEYDALRLAVRGGLVQ